MPLLLDQGFPECIFGEADCTIELDCNNLINCITHFHYAQNHNNLTPKIFTNKMTSIAVYECYLCCLLDLTAHGSVFTGCIDSALAARSIPLIYCSILANGYT